MVGKRYNSDTLRFFLAKVILVKERLGTIGYLCKLCFNRFIIYESTQLAHINGNKHFGTGCRKSDILEILKEYFQRIN